MSSLTVGVESRELLIYSNQLSLSLRRIVLIANLCKILVYLAAILEVLKLSTYEIS